MILSLTLAAGSGATGREFILMNATWDVAGKGEWHDSTITLTDLSYRFRPVTIRYDDGKKPRLILS